MVAWNHLTIRLSPNMLQSHNTVGHVQLVVTAARRIDNDHDWNSLQVFVADKARALIRIISVQLNEIGSLSDLSLNLII